MTHSPLIEEFLPLLKALEANEHFPVLDLACGRGRNGLYLIENGINVNFADINGESLAHIERSLEQSKNGKKTIGQCWQVDFEQSTVENKNSTVLKHNTFSAVIVFRYLHRPLFEQLKASIKPGGIIIYETFTEQQAQFGRPKNPDFLLKPKELVELFSDWNILHSFEGIKPLLNDDETKQAIAQIVAVKPV